MNQVILIGRLVKDPELKQTQTNKTYCKFSLAVGRQTKDAGVDFINCIVWNKQAENLAQYQQKGNKIAVSGSLQINDYTDKNGVNRQSTSVVCFSIEFLSEKKQQTPNQVYGQAQQYNGYQNQNINNVVENTGNNQIPNKTTPTAQDQFAVNDDDLPF